MTQATIDIPIINDDNNEQTERFQVQIGLVSGVTPSGVSIGNPNPTNIDITDNDSKTLIHVLALCIYTVLCYRYCCQV